MAGFARLLIDVLRADWKQFGRFVIKLTGSLIIFMLVFRRMPNTGSDIVKGLMLGVTCAGTYGWAQMCFTTQRYAGLLKKLLETATPMQVVISKFASALSMSLFTINVPGLLMPDHKFMFYLNSGVLFMTALCMAAAVISEQSYAPMIPLIAVSIPTLYMRDTFKDEFVWIQANATPLCVLALCAIPVLVYVSGRVFETTDPR